MLKKCLVVTLLIPLALSITACQEPVVVEVVVTATAENGTEPESTESGVQITLDGTEVPSSAGDVSEPTDTPTVEATAEEATAADLSDEVDDLLNVFEVATAIPTAVSSDPFISPISFTADETDGTTEYEVAESFAEGITKLYAVFAYENMPSGAMWERIWYLNGDPVLTRDETWEGESEGNFSYFLDGGGNPLPVGDWKFELYVDDLLLSDGEFVITGPPTATPTNTPAGPPTATPTLTPTATITPATATPRPVVRTHRLAFSGWNGEFHSVFISDTNGSNPRFIINRGTGPSFSADGRQLFFFAEQGVNQQFRADGNIACDFGTLSGGIMAFDLTPGDICEGRYGVWFCERRDGVRDVCSQDGIRIFQNLDWKEGSARWASVSPNGQLFAYDGRPGGDYRIYFQDLVSNQRTPFELIGEQASWSPNGAQLVYRSGRNNQTGIWISNRDDTGHRLITNNGTDSFPTWSPNGQQIAFSREVNGNVDIYTVNVNGSNLQRLTTANGPDTLPVYTPSGQIIFRSARTGSWGIWKMNGNGSGQVQIIPNVGVAPDWAFGKMDVQ